MAINRGSFDSIATLRKSFPCVEIGDYAQTRDTGSQCVYTSGGWMVGTAPADIRAGSVTSTYIYVDCNRTDSYVEDGTVDKPYKKFSTAVANVSSAFAVILAPGSYTETGDLSIPAYPMTVYGNKSTFTCSGTITVNEAHSIYDLNTVGSVVYAYTGSTRSMRIGGSINGTVTIQGGFPHFDSLNYTGAMTITGGTPYFRGITGGGRITVNGSSAILSINDANMNMSLVLANVTVTAGQAIIKGGLFVNSGTTANIVFNNTNSLATAHDLTQIVCNYGIACGSAYTILAPDNIIPVATGSYLLSLPSVPYFGVGGGTAQVQTATVPIVLSAYYIGLRIQYVVSVSNTGGAPTLNINTLGAKAVLKASTSPVAAGDLLIGMIADLIYDGTYFRLMNPAGI
jgi:hypothetical protein